jgi:hypothetical protein
MFAIRVQPGVHLGQWGGTQGIEAAPTSGTDTDQSRVPKNPQLLRDGRLRNPEMVDEFADRPLTLSKQIKDPAARGFSQGGERGHAPKYNRFGI